MIITVVVATTTHRLASIQIHKATSVTASSFINSFIVASPLALVASFRIS
jgi:hypothetical protein